MSLPRQISTFFGVGLVTFAADYGLFFILLNLIALDRIAAALGGYAFGGLVNYALNRAHTFETRRTHAQAGWRFVLVMAVGFALTWALMALLSGRLGLDPWPARLATTAIVFVFNFVAHRLWSFADAA